MCAEKRIPKQGEVYRALALGWMLYRNQQQHPLRWSISVAPAELVLVRGLCVRWRMARYWGGAHLWGRAIDSLFASSATAKDKRWAISTLALWQSLTILPIFVSATRACYHGRQHIKVKGKKKKRKKEKPSHFHTLPTPTQVLDWKLRSSLPSLLFFYPFCRRKFNLAHYAFISMKLRLIDFVGEASNETSLMEPKWKYRHFQSLENISQYTSYFRLPLPQK